MAKYYLVCAVTTKDGHNQTRDGIIDVHLSNNEDFTVEDINILKTEFSKQILNGKGSIRGIINFLNIV